MSRRPAPSVAGVDVGGTFTDAVVVGPDGAPVLAKVPTTPEDQGAGLSAALTAGGGTALTALAHGTTTATNAVLERAFGRPALLVTQGFADVLDIARQDRPSLYDLRRTRPAPAIPRDRVVGVAERVAADGSVVRPLTDDEVDRVVAELRRLDADAVAIVLLHSWADPVHEHRLAAAVAASLPDVHLTTSADLVGVFREYERASTCALNAAVGPLMARYLGRLGDRARDLAVEGVPPAVTVMTSGGGTASATAMAAEPVHTLLSGPAAGVVAAAECATRSGFADAVAFDMGGTSTDVCLIRGGRPVIDQRGHIDGLPIGTPTVGIHTVGAGGGSIAAVDAGGALLVGPRSAGAVPGPACYGRGGTEPTVTDAHAVLGHLTTLAGGALTPAVDAAWAAIYGAPGVQAQGVIDVVRAQMERALRRVTTEAGVDPSGLALVAYGGAGPLHASALGRRLGCSAVILPPAPGVLSAVGLLTAPRREEVSRSVVAELGPALRPQLDEVCAALAGRLDPAAQVSWAADVRYAGQSHELRVPFDGPAGVDDLGPVFAEAHRAAYGYDQPGTAVQVVTVHAVGTLPPLVAAGIAATTWDLGPDGPTATTTADLGDGPREVPVVPRGSLRTPGTTLHGPAIITQPDATCLLLDGDVATVGEAGDLVVRWDDAPPAAAVPSAAAVRSAGAVPSADQTPARLQVVRHALDGIAEVMGVALQRSAHSPNITERLDLSAALFDPDGQMIAQAEHIPVHLGSMPSAVDAVLAAFDLRPGMTAAINDPYTGGSHLPDLTLVTAVGDADGRLLGYVANRAHHADIAGSAPGSMAADAVDIAMEGLRVPPTLLVDAHGERPDVIELLAANSRTPEERRGDLRAQFAANHAGAARLVELATERGADALRRDMAALLVHGERRVRAAIAGMPDGTWSAADVLEVGEGLELRATVTVDGDRIVVDLRDCPPQIPANLNAVQAVTRSAALYVLRVLADPSAPANAGSARPLEVLTTPGTVVDAVFPAPVATGNVETSQRLVDLLLQALAPALPDRVPACSQGTMNNLLIGSRGTGRSFSYYETIGGGEGATPWRDGMSGVHTAMTNTRNTPVEALELAYPLRVVRSELRPADPDGGGAGRFTGGRGVIREIELLQDVTVTLQTERRRTAPPGAAGGAAGQRGRNTRITADGDEQVLPAKATLSVQAGDRIRIETPGGGGWGQQTTATTEGPSAR